MRALMRTVVPLLLTLATAAAAGEKPNIVFIMADDLGWSDVGFNGTKFYETPNLDRLSASGMKFSRAYSGGPNCLPTRACLVSGMYTPRTQIWTPGGFSKGSISSMKLLVPARGGPKTSMPSKLALEPSVVSIAEVLKGAGYRTARFGKWHVGKDTQGFDVSDPSGKGAPVGKSFYGNIDVHEWLTDASVKFIEENKGRPFFVYLCHWDVHTPIRARKDVVARFKEKLESGRWERKWNTTYAGMIEAVDVSVKRVQAKLDELGLARDTLLIFTSDNGGAHVTTNRPLKGAKGSLFEGGIRVPTFMRWPGKIEPGSQCDTPITSVDFMPTFAELAGARLPTSQPVDGTSIVPLLTGRKMKERSIFWHYPLYLSGNNTEGRTTPVFGTDRMYWRGVPASVVVRGPWKLIHYFEDDSTALYNLAEDIGETRDVSGRHPDVAAALRRELGAWQAETKAVIPTEPNPRFDKDAGEKGGGEKGGRKKRRKEKQ
ncbi:MAG: sulfatase [Planctomycetota bacterium]